MFHLLTGGKKLRRNYRKSTGRDLIPSAYLESGSYGSTGMLASSRGWHWTCKLQFRPLKMKPTFGSSLGLRGSLPVYPLPRAECDPSLVFVSYGGLVLGLIVWCKSCFLAALLRVLKKKNWPSTKVGHDEIVGNWKTKPLSYVMRIK